MYAHLVLDSTLYIKMVLVWSERFVSPCSEGFKYRAEAPMKGILSPANAGNRHAHIVLARLSAIAGGDTPHRGFERRHLKRCAECRAWIAHEARPYDWRDKFVPFKYESRRRGGVR